jgi:hypothetical protein
MPICGGLLRKEREIIEEMMASQAPQYVALAAACKEISDLEGITLSEAWRVLNNADTENKDLVSIRIKYADVVTTLTEGLAEETSRRKMATITAMMQVRGGLPEWGLEDWADQPDVIIDGLYQLALEEVAAEPQKDDVPPTDEQLGKSRPDDGDPIASTGTPASGT